MLRGLYSMCTTFSLAYNGEQSINRFPSLQLSGRKNCSNNTNYGMDGWWRGELLVLTAGPRPELRAGATFGAKSPFLFITVCISYQVGQRKHQPRADAAGKFRITFRMIFQKHLSIMNLHRLFNSFFKFFFIFLNHTTKWSTPLKRVFWSS